ncbi:MAG: hypothetical protein U0359_03985 [Byssovorax sp.]
MQSSFTAPRSRPLLAALALTAANFVGGCSGEALPNPEVARAQKWMDRAQSDLKNADFDEARDSVGRALTVAPSDRDARIFAAQLALSSLDYAETLRLLKDVHGSTAAGLRGRALWYKGELDAAADELDMMLGDPEAKDPWAKSIAKLARRGAGRTPFVLSGGLLAAVDMVHVSPVAPYFVLPIEIDGEAALAAIATGTPEVVLDSATRPEPSWVSLRFGQRLEVHDVPALAQDLSGISKEIGAPIKALLGVNVLRHLNVTIDYEGRQFVARTYNPPPPPNATRLNLHYVRGGGMLLRSNLGGEKGPRAVFLVDTSRPFPLALDKDGWKKAGQSVESLKLVAADPEQKLREGIVPLLRLGAFDVPRVLGVYGVPINELETLVSLDLDGVVGAGLLYQYRCTMGDEGRVLWIEDDTAVQAMLGGPGAGAPLAPPANEREAPPAEGPAPTAPPPEGKAPAKTP